MRNAALLALLYHSGLHIGEALALRPGDVDLEHAPVRVHAGKGDARDAHASGTAACDRTSWPRGSGEAHARRSAAPPTLISRSRFSVSALPRLVDNNARAVFCTMGQTALSEVIGTF